MGVSGRRAWLVAIATTTLWTALVVPAAANPEPTPSDPTPGASATPSPDATAEPGDGQSALTPDQVRRQLAQAERLQKEVTAANAEVAAASGRLAQLSAASGRAMSAVTTAKAAEKQAAQREKSQVELLRRLSREAAAAQRDVDRMAYDAYVNGSSSMRELHALVDLVAESGSRSQNASLVTYLADARAADGDRYTSLAKAQQETARAAVAARREKADATRRAVAARTQADAALARQREALTDLQATAKKSSQELGKLGIASGAGGGVDAAALGEVTTTPLCSDDLGEYPNGQLPGTALCPIDGSPGHMMRPDAARAFNALRAAYRKDLGQELCLTDSYRSYAAQVDVKRRKPVLAATPGTSNHGLGRAVDLCGGIESFGTPQHLWMKQHAPLFGFFLPAWAEATGSKPEPWHWEFGG